MEKKSFIEALKEVSRLVLSAVIGYLLMEGVVDSLVTIFGGQMDTTLKVIVSGLITSIVRGVDRYIHVSPNIDSKGFLPK